MAACMCLIYKSIASSFLHVVNKENLKIGFFFWEDHFYLFVYSFSSHSRILHSFGDVTINGEGMQILTYALHLWSLSSDASLACHTYYDTGHPFIMVSTKDP